MLIEDNDKPEGGDNNPEADQPEADPIKAELAAVKSQNEELLTKFNSFLAAQNTAPKSEDKKLSATEFKELMEKDPQAAIQYAISSQVNASTQTIERQLTTKQQVQYYDQKTEQDFPLLNKDKAFADLVKKEIRTLVDDGMSKDSPKLLYKAAEIAALKYKGAQDTKAKETKEAKEMSSEAPSTVRPSTDAKASRGDEMMFKAFNMSKKAQEIYLRNKKEAAAEADRRKGRN